MQYKRRESIQYYKTFFHSSLLSISFTDDVYRKGLSNTGDINRVSSLKPQFKSKFYLRNSKVNISITKKAYSSNYSQIMKHLPPLVLKLMAMILGWQERRISQVFFNVQNTVLTLELSYLASCQMINLSQSFIKQVFANCKRFSYYNQNTGNFSQRTVLLPHGV